jgi:HD-GYP domain-containing protein (c-di-GMP phosphodiesterase class II)
MTIRRLTLSDLAFGEPLRWDIFGPAAASLPPPEAPLLQKGQLIAPGPELESWLAAGLYAEAEAPPASVLHTLNEIASRLERLLREVRNDTSTQQAGAALALELIATVTRAPDIALASIYLNQLAGLYSVRHCIEAAIVVVLVGRGLDLSQDALQSVCAAALTMNVGMLDQDQGYQRQALTSSERSAMQRHPADGVEMLRAAGVTDQEWLDCVLMHHENDDGSGYPEGRSGAEVPRSARLIALADRYCAYVSARNYRRSLSPEDALRKLCDEHTDAADMALTALFEKEIGATPPGTLVKVASGAIGVVKHRSDGSGALALHLLRDGAGQPLSQYCVNTDAGCAIMCSMHEDEARLRFSMKSVWGDLASI